MDEYVDADLGSFNEMVPPSESVNADMSEEASQGYEVGNYIMTGMGIGGVACMLSLGVSLIIAIMRK